MRLLRTICVLAYGVHVHCCCDSVLGPAIHTALDQRVW